MIDLFDDYTYELTDREKLEILPRLVKKLRLNVGKKMVVSNRQICASFKSAGVDIKPERIRKLIHLITVNNQIPGLIASSDGYYVSSDPEEMKIYIRSLEQRANAILRRKLALEEQLQKLKTEV